MNSFVDIRLGPGDPFQVLAALLNGSEVNYIIMGGSRRAVKQIILTPVPAIEQKASEEPAPEAAPAATEVAAEPAAQTAPPSQETQVAEAQKDESISAAESPAPSATAKEKEAADTLVAQATQSAEEPHPTEAHPEALPGAPKDASEQAQLTSPADPTKLKTAKSKTDKQDQDADSTSSDDTATASGDGSAAPASGDEVAQDTPAPDPSATPGDAAVPVADQTPPVLPVAIASGASPVVMPGPFSANASTPGSNEVTIPNPAAEHVGQSAQANTGNTGGSSAAASVANGGSFNVPGIPPDIQAEICQYYGGSCQQVAQELSNKPPAQPVQPCAKIFYNPVTQAAGCAN